MKKAFPILSTLLISVLVFTTSFAQTEEGGAIKVTLNDHTPFRLVVDGRVYKKHGTSLTVGNLPRGRHNIEVFAYYPNSPRPMRRDLIYDGKLKIHDNEFLNVIVNVNTGDAKIIVGTPPVAQSNNRVAGNDDIYNNNSKGPELQDQPNTISQDELSKIQQQVNDQVTDTDKEKTLQSLLKKKHLSTKQVAQIFTWFNFDDTKVDFAKWAYDHVVDTQSYSALENGLSNDNARNELHKYIGQRAGNKM